MAYMACLRSRVLTDSCSQRRYQRQSICQACLSNPFLQSEIEQQIIWHIVASQSRPLFPEILRYGAVSVARTKPIVCNAFSVCGLRTQECCVTPLNNNNNNRTGDWRTCNLKVATPTQVSSCKNRVLTWYSVLNPIFYIIIYNNLIFGLKHSKFDNQGVYLMLWTRTLISCYFIRFL